MKIAESNRSNRETLFSLSVRTRRGQRCRSGIADSFDFARAAGFPAILVAQQFRGLAIDILNEPGHLAVSHAGAAPFGQRVGRFITPYQ